MKKIQYQRFLASLQIRWDLVVSLNLNTKFPNKNCVLLHGNPRLKNWLAFIVNDSTIQLTIWWYDILFTEEAYLEFVDFCRIN